MFKKIANIVLLVILAVTGKCLGDVAVVSLDPTTTDNDFAWPTAGSNHGWQFTVNQSVTVTHLGLFDKGANGFVIDHPIGLWRLNDGTLLASGTIGAGTVDILTNYFRYIDVPDVQLSVGVNYVIGFYSDTAHGDYEITNAHNLQLNPNINIIVSRNDGAGQFQMPADIFVPPPPWEPYDPDEFGPNFLFEVPEPASVALIMAGGMFLTLRRNRRR